MTRNVRNIAAAVFAVLPALLFAAPVPKIDSANFDVGILKEGTNALLKHTFYIKNIGDSTLKLLTVRAKCGCTAVSFDSIIPPGKSGTVVAQINPQNFSEGTFEKSIMVGFNSDKLPQTSLTIHGIWKHMVTVTPDQAQFMYGKGADSGVTLTISTDQKNFNVQSVSFLMNEDSPMDWSSRIPMNFTLSKVPVAIQQSTSKDQVYKLTINYMPNEKRARYGQLIIKTNIPGKPEIKVSGMLQGHKQ